MPNPVIHFEIESTDQAATRAFFGEVFGWKTDYMPEMDYALVDTRSEGAGINGGIGPPTASAAAASPSTSRWTTRRRTWTRRQPPAARS